MKKFAVILPLFLMVFANAQTVKLGVTGSFHKGSIGGVHGISKPDFGGSAGVFIDFSLVTNDIYDGAWLYFTPQLELYTVGERGDWDEDESNFQKYSNAYIAMPLYIKYFFGNRGYKGDIFIMAGPKIEYLVYSDKEEGFAPQYAAQAGFDPEIFGLDRKMKKFGYGISAKLGIRMSPSTDIFFRFDRGISNVYSDYHTGTAYNKIIAIGFSHVIKSNF